MHYEPQQSYTNGRFTINVYKISSYGVHYTMNSKHYVLHPEALGFMGYKNKIQ